MMKSEFLEKIETSYQEYENAITALKEAQVFESNSCGGWSVKDIIAHIAWYEREMVGVIKTRTLAGSDLWDIPLDQRNTIIHNMNQSRSLEEIQVEASQVHQILIQLIQDLYEDYLQDASHFAGMPPDWIPAEVIASNTFEHYRDHLLDIQKAFTR